MDGAIVRIDGLAAFRRDLKKIDNDLPKELRQDLLVIGQVIAAQAQGIVPRKTGRAAGSIRAGVSGNNAYIAGGTKAVPYYGWLDFGSRNPVRGNPRRVGPWTNSGPGQREGRFIYPTIRRNKQEIEKKAQKAFDDAAERALEKSY